MTQTPSERSIDLGRDRRIGLLWLGIALLMRFAFLPAWSLWGDEYYTYTDAERVLTSAQRESGEVYPLFFVLVKGALHLLPDSLSLEFRLRSVAALAGALVAWVVYRGTRSLLPMLERNLVTAFVVFSPWLLFLSQWARFYSLLLLFSCAAVFLLLRALDTNSMGRAWMALLCVILAIATHPSAVLLLGSMIASGILLSWLGLVRGRRALFPLYAMLALAGLLLLASLLRWDLVQKTIIRKLSDTSGGTESVPELVQGVVYNLGLPVSILSGLGVLVLFRKDRRLFWFVLVGAGLPTLIVLYFASRGAEMDQRYLIPEVALMLIPAAVLLGDMMRRIAGTARLGAATFAALVFLPAAPSLYSHYVDGNSHDLRAAARFIEERWQDGDAIVCETNALMAMYLKRVGVAHLIEAPPKTPEEYSNFSRAVRNDRRLWVVIPDDFQFRGGAEASFHEWTWTHLKLVREFYPPRIDYHQNRLLVFLTDTEGLSRWTR